MFEMKMCESSPTFPFLHLNKLHKEIKEDNILTATEDYYKFFFI
jgi:hypothetical protein